MKKRKVKRMPTLLSILIKVKWEMFREIIEKELYVYWYGFQNEC